MDQLTHNVRCANWLNIINQCQERLANITIRQWLKDNDIKEKSYYYWLRKFRKVNVKSCAFRVIYVHTQKS